MIVAPVILGGVILFSLLAASCGNETQDSEPVCPNNETGAPDTPSDPRYALELDCDLVSNTPISRYPIEILCHTSDFSMPENCDGSIEDLEVTCYQDGVYRPTTMVQGDHLYYRNGEALTAYGTAFSYTLFANPGGYLGCRVTGFRNPNANDNEGAPVVLFSTEGLDLEDPEVRDATYEEFNAIPYQIKGHPQFPLPQDPSCSRIGERELVAARSAEGLEPGQLHVYGSTTRFTYSFPSDLDQDGLIDETVPMCNGEIMPERPDGHTFLNYMTEVEYSYTPAGLVLSGQFLAQPAGPMFFGLTNFYGDFINILMYPPESQEITIRLQSGYVQVGREAIATVTAVGGARSYRFRAYHRANDSEYEQMGEEIVQQPGETEGHPTNEFHFIPTQEGQLRLEVDIETGFSGEDPISISFENCDACYVNPAGTEVDDNTPWSGPVIGPTPGRDYDTSSGEAVTWQFATYVGRELALAGQVEASCDFGVDLPELGFSRYQNGTSVEHGMITISTPLPVTISGQIPCFLTTIEDVAGVNPTFLYPPYYLSPTSPETDICSLTGGLPQLGGLAIDMASATDGLWLIGTNGRVYLYGATTCDGETTLTCSLTVAGSSYPMAYDGERFFAEFPIEAFFGGRIYATCRDEARDRESTTSIYSFPPVIMPGEEDTLCARHAGPFVVGGSSAPISGGSDFCLGSPITYEVFARSCDGTQAGIEVECDFRGAGGGIRSAVTDATGRAVIRTSFTRAGGGPFVCDLTDGSTGEVTLAATELWPPTSYCSGSGCDCE